MQKEKQQDFKGKSKFQALRSQVDPQLMKIWQQQQNLIKKYIVQKNEFEWDLQTLTLVAGVDLSASKINPSFACVTLIIYNVKTQSIQYEDSNIIKINQPYIPGFLAFREIPPLYHMFNDLKKKKPQLYPQLILLDGNGILHSNYCGLASHLGVLLNMPTIGAGKTLFFIDGLTKDRVKQQCQKQILKVGDYSLLKGDSGKIWGACLRATQSAKNPIYVSIGTKIQLFTSIQIVKKLSIYRVVQPIRLADKKSRQIIDKINIKELENSKIQAIKYDMVFLNQLKNQQ